MDNIQANKITIGKNVEISPEAKIICDNITIGDGTVIAGNTKIICMDCVIGRDNFFHSILIEGALNAGKTRIKIGNENLILQDTRLNCNEYLEIGDDVNIGQRVSIWTHASSMDVFNGYPFTKAPVIVGSHVWITANTTILPGVTIGSHVIIGNASVVNKNLPSGCFAAGIPVKIVKENIYPMNLSQDQKSTIVESVVSEYRELIKLKPYSAYLNILNKTSIQFISDGHSVIFDCNNRKIIGDLNEYSEDFRDFLRYRGIKFFINKPFKAIPPKWYLNATKNAHEGTK